MAGIVYSRLWIKVMALWSFPYVCVEKPYVCNVFRPRATWKMGNTCHTRVHIRSMTFTLFAQNSTVVSMLALCGSTMYVATLGPKKAMNLAPLFEDIWTIFFRWVMTWLITLKKPHSLLLLIALEAINRFGLYHVIKMKFGLQDTTATIQHMMDHLLQDLQGLASAYLDDLMIYGNFWEDYLQHVFQCVKDVCLTAKEVPVHYATV